MAYLCPGCPAPQQEASLAGGDSWLGVAIIERHLASHVWGGRWLSAGTYAWLPHGSFWVAGLWLKAPKGRVPVKKAGTALPDVTRPWKSGHVTSLHSTGYKQVTNSPSFQARWWRPYLSIEGMSRSHCELGDIAGPSLKGLYTVLSIKVCHMVFTQYCLCPVHPLSNLTASNSYLSFRFQLKPHFPQEPALTAPPQCNQAPCLDVPSVPSTPYAPQSICLSPF